MSTDWFEPIRAYCERAGAGFWDEPLNAATNAAFLVAALAAARRAGRDPAALALTRCAGARSRGGTPWSSAGSTCRLPRSGRERGCGSSSGAPWTSPAAGASACR
ncbi:hypothetical protein [Methylobacterium hispanicum]|uniref:hypothetical protein n=1 Tax=Methylobacterium hispanicum TaxID=270350 RepID=UPI002F33BE55